MSQDYHYQIVVGYNMNITRFEKFMLKRICKRIVKQSPDHKSNITEYFRIIRRAASKEFTEDNAPTQKCFLQECFDASYMEINHDK